MKSFSKLSIVTIRERLSDQPVSPRMLHQLRRDPRLGVQRFYETLKERYEKERTERLRLDAMLNFERLLWKSGTRHIAGVDEVGVGPLAGPVVAAAVVFPPTVALPGVDDSKRLTPEERETLAIEIRKESLGIGIGVAEVGEIDRLNIYHASLLAMRRAVDALPTTPDHVLVDARTIPQLPMPQNAFNQGDGINFSIAAASIIAKTHRDRLMRELDKVYPGYGFAKHKGYSTGEHQAAIRRLGPCLIHRMSYPFIRELCGDFSQRFYSLKQQLEASKSAEKLRRFEALAKDQWSHLTENEQRKLRLMLLRRWKTASS
jgi:ribonuclease HII